MRIASALFAAVLVVVTFAACAGQPTTQTETAPAAGTDSQAQAPVAPEGQAAQPAEGTAAPGADQPAAGEKPAEAPPQN